MNSVVAALVLIVLYITVRFIFRYGIAAIIALVHDVLITLGVFSLLDKEISLSIIAAFLTIIGYSLNDTIVVFDRIRENMRLRRKESYRQVINRSINECLSRTVLTSLTTLFVAGTLYVIGGAVIHDFAFALCFGVVIGTYSSIFIASPVLVWWYERRIADRKRAQPAM
jgi:preprotein translocase SecF subunit